MDQFITCPSCGFTFAPYMEFLDKARISLYDKVVFAKDSPVANHDAEKLALNPGSAPPLEEIFDALNISNRCCRMRMTSRMNFGKLYL